MSNEQVACPVCDGLAIRSLVNINLPFYECDNCGRYALGYEYEMKIDKDAFSSFLYYNCNLFASPYEEEPVFYYIGNQTSFDLIHKEHSNSRLITIKEVENWYPKNFSEKIDYILLGLSKLSDYTGKSIFIIGSMANSMLFLKRFTGNNQLSKENIDEQMEYFISYLEKQNLAKKDLSSITLLPDGLKRIDELQKNKSVSKQVFIAIAFSDDMREVQEAIEEGIRKAGYNPHIMNKNKHNNQIVPEILFQIKQSKFIVAEFSNKNNGAYYEAGYAAGLGKEVIHICNKKVFGKKGHFDIKQKSTILWEKVDDISNDLYAHIKATII